MKADQNLQFEEKSVKKQSEKNIVTKQSTMTKQDLTTLKNNSCLPSDSRKSIGSILGPIFANCGTSHKTPPDAILSSFSGDKSVY